MDEKKPAREAQIARIRALMAKTVENGCTEAEAKAAAAAVDRLMNEYEVDLDDLTVRNSECVKATIECGTHHVKYAAKMIGQFCDCKVWTDNGRDLVFLGIELDTEVAEYLVIRFMRAIDREAESYTMMNADYALRDRAGQNEMLHSFKVGIATRLGERLTELKGKRDFRKVDGAQSLVVVKSAVVAEAFASLGITLAKGSAGRSIRDQGAYVAGRNAAEGVSISQGIHGGRGGGSKAIR